MKTIVICGTSKNLGKYLSENFSKQNKVFKLSRSANKKDKNQITCNISKKEDAKKSLKFLKYKEKKIDAFIFCIGDSSKNYDDIAKSNHFDQSFKANFYPFVNLLNSYLEIFKKKPTKFIVISSIASLRNINAPMTYSLAKRALNFYCSIMAKELAKNEIIINLISPGNILMENNNWSKKIKVNKHKVKKYIKENVPSNKFCTPHEIFQTCEFIINNQGNLVGSNIIIDGGQVL